MVFETLVYFLFKRPMWLLSREYLIELNCLESFKLNNTLFKEQGYNYAPLISGRNMVSVLTDCAVYPTGPDTCTVGILAVHGVILSHVFHSSLAWAVLC